MKQKLTIKDHALLARHLRSIAAEITAIREVVSGYNLVSSVGRRLFATENKLRELKSILDDVMFRDHPDDPRANPDVYYGRVDRGYGEASDGH